ncbi:MAG: amidohydrolase [Ardenticatenaceae bacterium]|nr:amidohydrolase [Ardenticatenaceae bacterium]
MKTKQEIADWLDEHQIRFTTMSDKIWDNPEKQFQEFIASKLQADFLEQEGFTITWDVGGMSTAFIAEWGEGKPVIAFAGEYDALPGLSQKDQNTPDPIEPNGWGHGCGHNLLGTGCLAAAVGFKVWLEATGNQATVRYYGCPAEEGGGGKTFMGRAGVFDDIDATFNWHPGQVNSAMKGSMLGLNRYQFTFKGITSHAAATPHAGRSALDAVELMNVGVNYMREHVTPDVRIHYIITEGGLAANVVPDRASSDYVIRAIDPRNLEETTQRVLRIAQGAALMTDTELDAKHLGGASSVLSNHVLADVQYEVMQELGGIDFTEEEMAYAAKINEYFTDANKQQLMQRFGLDAVTASRPLIGGVYPSSSDLIPASTDMGDMSRYAPCSMLRATTWTTRTPGHSWGAVATGRMSIGHKGMMYAAKVMALAAAELIIAPEKLEKAKEEFEAAMKEQPYKSPLPEGAQPPQFEHSLR